MPSRRRFIATGAIAALTASLIPRVGTGQKESGDHPDRTPGKATHAGGAGGSADSSRALRRARSRAAIGQSVPFPES